MHASLLEVIFQSNQAFESYCTYYYCVFGADMCVYLGEDGPSQMGLEDLAMFRAIPTATIFYPSDGVSTERAVELAANTKVPIVSCNKTF